MDTVVLGAVLADRPLLNDVIGRERVQDSNISDIPVSPEHRCINEIEINYIEMDESVKHYRLESKRFQVIKM